VGEAEGQCGEIATYRYKFDERLPDARAGLEKLSEALKSASGGKHKKYQGVFVKKLTEAEELQTRETSSDVERAITSLDEIIKQIGELAAASDAQAAAPFPRSNSTCALAAWASAKPGSAAIARSNPSIAPGYIVSFA